MQRLLSITIALCLLLSGCSDGVSNAAGERAQVFLRSKNDLVYSPRAKAEGEPFTIGVVDIDPYYPSGEMLYYIVDSLREMGWIDEDVDFPFDPSATDVKEFVNYLAGTDLGDYIEFSQEANYYIAVDDEQNCRDSLNALVERGELDMVISLGTLASQFTEEVVDGRIPTIVCFCVDPVANSLTGASDYSGMENVWAFVDNIFYDRQLEYFRYCCDFSNIGMIYYDENVAAMTSYRQAAEKLGIKITERKIQRMDAASSETVEEYYREYISMIEELLNEGIDAFMINADMITHGEAVKAITDMLYERGIPVFSQESEDFIMENGAMVSILTSDAASDAPFVAETISAVLNGVKPEEISQQNTSATFVKINMTAVKKLECDIPKEVIDYAGKVFY